MELHKISRRSFLEATALSGAAAVFSHPLSGGLVSTASAAEAPIAAAAEEETKIVKTCCRACIHNCGVLAHVRNGRVVKLEGNPEYPMSKGALCAKALSGVSALYHPNRNKYPLLRVGKRGENKWRRISWNEAIDIIAKKMETVRHEYGAEAVLVTTGGGGNPAFRGIPRLWNTKLVRTRVRAVLSPANARLRHDVRRPFNLDCGRICTRNLQPELSD